MIEIETLKRSCAEDKITWTVAFQEAKMMCMYCKSGDFIESTTTHVVNYKHSLIVVENVPCMECKQCGETYYTDAVAERLEEIVNSIKKFAPKISIVDYNTAA